MHWAASSGKADPDARREGIEDNPRGRLWKEIRRLLGHDLARTSDRDYVRNRGRPQQEGRLARPRLEAIQEKADIPRVAEVALRLQLGRVEAQLALEDLPVEDRHVKLGNRVGGAGRGDVDGDTAAGEGDADAVVRRGFLHRR